MTEYEWHILIDDGTEGGTHQSVTAAKCKISEPPQGDDGVIADTGRVLTLLDRNEMIVFTAPFAKVHFARRHAAR